MMILHQVIEFLILYVVLVLGLLLSIVCRVVM